MKRIIVLLILIGCIAQEPKNIVASMPAIGDVIEGTFFHIDSTIGQPYGLARYEYTQNTGLWPNCHIKIQVALEDWHANGGINSEVFIEDNGQTGAIGFTHYELDSLSHITEDSSHFFWYQVIDMCDNQSCSLCE